MSASAPLVGAKRTSISDCRTGSLPGRVHTAARVPSRDSRHRSQGPYPPISLIWSYCQITTGHRLGIGPPRACGRAGVVEHVLLRNADPPAAGGDLALLHARDQMRREACVTDVRELALPPDVLVAGREFHPRRGCQT